MKFKGFLFSLLLAAFAMSLSLFAFAAASDITSDVKLTFENIRSTALTDNDIDTAASGKNVKITIESDAPIGGVWLRYSADPISGYLDGDKKIAENGFWSEYIEIGKISATLTFEEVTLCEINVYSEGELPANVQRWEFAQNETDIMLFSAHSDDDQLFFAGLVPYYVARGDVDIKVCFFTTSYQQISRVQELLAGLWHCGLKTYPIILPLPDEYSESLNRAGTLLSRSGYSSEAVTDIVRGVLNTYKPSVIVLHDFEGEYGHGMHRYSAKAVIDAVESAAETDFVPSKIYSHLFAQNEIVLPIDEPLEALGNKSAFNISQEGFQFHKSQHWTWFYGWIYGERTKITSASQIKTYNPAHYGLYLSLVGTDSGNDMLENIETVAMRRTREEAEALAQAEAETKVEMTTAAETEATYSYIEENTAKAEKTKGFSMRFVIFPIIILIILATTLFITWVVEKKTFVNVNFPENEE